MKIGYIRVSTKEQKTDRQDFAFDKLELDKIFSESISGKNINRPELSSMLDFVRDGDILYIESLSRLGRSMKDLVSIVEILNEKNVQLVSLKENIDTTTPQGKLMFHIFASLSEFERETIRQRQKEGIEVAKRKGKFKGRKPIKVNKTRFEELYFRWKDDEITAVEMMRMLKMKKTTFYKKVKEYETLRGDLKNVRD